MGEKYTKIPEKAKEFCHIWPKKGPKYADRPMFATKMANHCQK